MFVAEDPGGIKGVKAKEIQQARARSHVTSWYHRKRRQNLPRHKASAKRSPESVGGSACSVRTRRSSETSLSEGYDDQSESSVELVVRVPPSPKPMNLHSSGFGLKIDELRGLQFFREKTAANWSGWQDTKFWSELALQASHIVPGLRYAFVALGSVQEYYETKSHAQQLAVWDYSLSQGRRALTHLGCDYANMSASAILITYIVLTALATFQPIEMYLTILKNGHDMVNELSHCDSPASQRITTSDRDFALTYLKPIIQRTTFLSTHLMDFLPTLSMSPASDFRLPCDVHVPASFTDLKHARDVLENILIYITFQAKSLCYPPNFLPPENEKLLEDWSHGLSLLERSSSLTALNRHSVSLLRVCAKLNLVLIQTMTADDEMVFDKHIEVYEELLTVAQKYMTLRRLRKTPMKTFGTDGGFITLMSNVAQRWCREPTIRRQIINILYNCGRWDGIEGAAVSAEIANRLMMIEESNCPSPPRHCKDITAESRIRIFEVGFYVELELIQIRYAARIHEAYCPKDVIVHWATSRDDLPPEEKVMPPRSDPPQQQPDVLPDMRMGIDYVMWLDKSQKKYNTIRSTKFHFCLPRI